MIRKLTVIAIVALAARCVLLVVLHTSFASADGVALVAAGFVLALFVFRPRLALRRTFRFSRHFAVVVGRPRRYR